MEEQIKPVAPKRIWIITGDHARDNWSDHPWPHLPEEFGHYEYAPVEELQQLQREKAELKEDLETAKNSFSTVGYLLGVDRASWNSFSDFWQAACALMANWYHHDKRTISIKQACATRAIITQSEQLRAELSMLRLEGNGKDKLLADAQQELAAAKQQHEEDQRLIAQAAGEVLTWKEEVNFAKQQLSKTCSCRLAGNDFAQKCSFHAEREDVLHEWAARAKTAEQQLAEAATVVEQFELDEYDAGCLNDYGGGNVGWWQDYVRYELNRAYECYKEQVDSLICAARTAQAGEKQG